MTLFLVLMLLLSGCDSITSFLNTPTPTPSAATVEPPAAALEQTPTPRSPDNLIVWVDPLFAPDPETESGQLFLDRLDAFENANPGITVTVRVKARTGQAGMLETLSNVSIAAPTLTPDLVILNPDLLQLAHIRGLVYSLDGMYEAPSTPDWYSFAVKSSLDESIFVSVPVGAEAQAFAYRSDRFLRKPTSWPDILEGSAPVVIPAADPEALLTLSLYEASGGNFLDEEEAPTLQDPILTEVLSLYAGARASGLMPASVLDLSSSEETWSVLHEGRAGIALAPLTRFLNEHNPDTEEMIPIPVAATTSLTIAETWGWAVTTDDSSRRALVTELLAWLSAPEFTGPWTESIGLLPASRQSLDTWKNGNNIALANLLIPSARSIIPLETRETFGTALQSALESVIDGTSTADSAARDAAIEINSP